MSIEVGQKYIGEDGEVVEVIEVFLYKDAFYVVDFKYKNGKKESQCGMLTQVDFLEQYKPYKPKPIFEYKYLYGVFISRGAWGDGSKAISLYTEYLTDDEFKEKVATHDRIRFQKQEETKRERK